MTAPHTDQDEQVTRGLEALEGIEGGVDKLLKYLKDQSKATPQPQPPPEVNVAVAAPMVHVASPATPPAPNVAVNVPPQPKEWTIDVTERDRDGRLKSFKMKAL